MIFHFVFPCSLSSCFVTMHDKRKRKIKLNKYSIAGTAMGKKNNLNSAMNDNAGNSSIHHHIVFAEKNLKLSSLKSYAYISICDIRRC